VDSQSFIRCSLPRTMNEYSSTQKSYITPLTVSVGYTYTSVNEWEVEIKRNDMRDEEITQGLCGAFEVEYGGKCLTKCEYCATHPGDLSVCGVSSQPDFQFNKNFKCGCDLSTCNAKTATGSCVKGFCPGSLYCCSTLKCDQWQVEYMGECVDKCWYCRYVKPDDYNICRGINLDGFECLDITKEACIAAGSSCVQGFCGGNNINKYCSRII
jgi:hypothetical protein